MYYVDFLDGLHRRLEPPTYLEIGIKEGRSLARSRSPKTIAIDPKLRLTYDLACSPTLVQATSDEYFARADALAPFEGQPIALSFIDGMHLFEFALRDFINVERHTRWWSVVAFDDVFPRWPAEAARDRFTTTWTGDVYKMLLVLERQRRDLICLRVNTMPTGLLLVLGCDPDSTLLAERYRDLEAEHVTPDPQTVPGEILDRGDALDPERLLASPIWSVLRDSRREEDDGDDGRQRLRRALKATIDDARVDFTMTPLERPRIYPLEVPLPTVQVKRVRRWLTHRR